MPRILNPNIDILERTVDKLGELTERLVFLGGCATGLLLSDLAAPPIRLTDDVDVITEAGTWAEYNRLSESLRAKGFHEDSGEGAPICRWRAENVILDVMPTDPNILGFGSIWYQKALETAMHLTLPSGRRIRMITAPYFIACKFAAFESRGNNDYLMSHDIEDIVAVLDGRPEVISEIQEASAELKGHLVEQFQTLLANDEFREALPGHLPGDAASQARLPIILDRMREITTLSVE